MVNVSTVNEEKLWQMLELVASPDCDIDTEILASALDRLINGTKAEKEEGARQLQEEMDRCLP